MLLSISCFVSIFLQTISSLSLLTHILCDCGKDCKMDWVEMLPHSMLIILLLVTFTTCPITITVLSWFVCCQIFCSRTLDPTLALHYAYMSALPAWIYSDSFWTNSLLLCRNNTRLRLRHTCRCRITGRQIEICKTCCSYSSCCWFQSYMSCML